VLEGKESNNLKKIFWAMSAVTAPQGTMSSKSHET